MVGADKALNLFMESKKKLGHWVFKTNADHQLVMSVCVQIKGDIFRGLGLWTRAASDLIQSIFGFKSLPKVDIKGWAASLSLLADSFQYMSLSDFIQEMKPKFQLSSNHPILEAIKCVNEAAQLSIYSPLFFAKNKVNDLSIIYTLDLLHHSSISQGISWCRDRYLSSPAQHGSSTARLKMCDKPTSTTEFPCSSEIK